MNGFPSGNGPIVVSDSRVRRPQSASTFAGESRLESKFCTRVSVLYEVAESV
jgi:hypothetical protein